MSALPLAFGPTSCITHPSSVACLSASGGGLARVQVGLGRGLVKSFSSPTTPSSGARPGSLLIARRADGASASRCGRCGAQSGSSASVGPERRPVDVALAVAVPSWKATWRAIWEFPPRMTGASSGQSRDESLRPPATWPGSSSTLATRRQKTPGEVVVRSAGRWRVRYACQRGRMAVTANSSRDMEAQRGYVQAWGARIPGFQRRIRR